MYFLTITSLSQATIWIVKGSSVIQNKPDKLQKIGNLNSNMNSNNYDSHGPFSGTSNQLGTLRSYGSMASLPKNKGLCMPLYSHVINFNQQDPPAGRQQTRGFTKQSLWYREQSKRWCLFLTSTCSKTSLPTNQLTNGNDIVTLPKSWTSLRMISTS